MSTSNRDKVYLDPTMYIPEGMIEWSYRNAADDQIGWDDDDAGLGTTDDDASLVDEGEDSGEEDPSPDTVDNLVVVSQKLRRTKDGKVVVDMVVEVDDVRGVNKYEIGVTKVDY